jgi:hypothetical protein
VPGRVEGLTDLVAPFEAEPGEHGQCLVAHGLHAVEDGRGSGPGVGQGELEVVDDRQPVRRHAGAFGGALPLDLADHALPLVVEVRQRAPPAIFELLDPRLQLGDAGRPNLCRLRLCLVGGHGVLIGHGATSAGGELGVDHVVVVRRARRRPAAVRRCRPR